MSWEALNQSIIHCQNCSRLVHWREEIARKKRKAYLEWTYWGKPVPGFGDRHAEILILGLAPGAHGSNRTGRMFTGDASGDFLFPALYRAGFSNQPHSISMDDGLTLYHVFITAVCRCVPPRNKPLKEEKSNCSPFLDEEIRLLGELQGIVALGQVAYHAGIELLRNHFNYKFSKSPKFRHGLFLNESEKGAWMMASYHPSRQNTQTGRLSEGMFDEIWQKAAALISTPN